MADDKIILIHNGALGDFLIAWPAALAVARRHGGNAALLYAGRESYAAWARAAGFDPAPADIRAAINRLYTTADWNHPALAPLTSSLVVWVGLHTPPFNPVLMNHEADASARLVFLPMVGNDLGQESTRDCLARKLDERLAIPWPEDTTAVWRTRIASWTGSSGEVLLFPGAGHRAKEWPARSWRALADTLLERGLPCRFVLGPAELERGFHAQDTPTVEPDSLSALTSRIARAAAVVSADTGPMHLAALTGTPALALFGPTSAQQWAPADVRVMRARVDCRPCSNTTRDIDCTTHHCMATIAVDDVAQRVLELVTG